MQKQFSQNILETEIAIVGGGIIGLSIAYALAEKGKNIAVIEKGKAGREASWAAAGLLSPLVDNKDDKELLNLFREAQKMYPAFIKKLEKETGIDIEYNDAGCIQVALDESEARELEKEAILAKEQGVKAKLLSPEEVKSLEPLLTEKIIGGLLLPMEVQLNNRNLNEALLKALKKRNIVVKEHTAVKSIIEEAGKIKGLLTSKGIIKAQKIINCAGAWATQLTPEVKVKPIKGQMLRFDVKGMPDIKHIIMRHLTYLLPRKDSTVVVGTTAEDVGFDKKMTEEGYQKVYQGITELIPSLRQCPVVETWAGLRPKGMAEKPVIAKLRQCLYVAASHFKNGIILAPITAKLMQDLILEEKETGFELQEAKQ